VQLTLLVRAYCHLCDEMRDELALMLEPGKATVALADVDADPALEERWGDMVPVLLAGEHELCHYRLDRVAVARWLRETSDATSR
jgi:Glutaredoxin-like domain (DUF836)